MPGPEEAAAKRIRLGVQSGSVDLRAIARTISGLKELSSAATRANQEV